MKSINKLQDYIAIGELSEMTGIGVHTLRVWEKRYGAPHSQRLPSGHRRYPKEEVPRLKAIASALESGYRASKVVTATMEELQGLMGLAPFTQPKPDSDSKKQDKLSSDKTVIEGWAQLIHAGKDDELLSGFHEQFGRHGALDFICDFAVPLLERIGNGWETGELSITHEHFASECLVSFLNEKWRQMNVRKTGPRVLITTLPGEGYSLGILMCAVITSTTNSKIMYLGVDNPIDEIVDASEKYNPELIAMSISHKFDNVTSEKLLIQLRKKNRCRYTNNYWW
jgi:methanogenic corrinoid protein MtbC1